VLGLITDEELNRFRLSGEKVRVQRDNDRNNDVRGIIVAWDDKFVVIRKPNRNLLKLPRYYVYTPARPRARDIDRSNKNDFSNPDRAQIKNLLVEAKTIAVVGLSDNPERTSYQISKEMQARGYRIIPVNPNISQSLGEKAVSSLLEIDQPVDIVNIFRRSEKVMPVVEEAIRIKLYAIWMQLGVVNANAAQLAKEHGIVVIMDRCIKVEHALVIPHN
jgi:predicted CoA-binding protein